MQSAPIAPFKMPNIKHPFFLAILVAVVVLTAARISGTSSGVYNILFYGDKFHDPNLLLGQPRMIRSDEWNVQTPWTAAQAQIGFAQDNTLYAAGQNLTTMNVPVANWVMAFKPFLWPYFFLPVEYAFALSWWMRSAILLVVSYLLLLRVTKEDRLLSALGALAFLYSPYLQWWTTGMIDIAYCGLLTFYFSMEIIGETRRARLALDILLLAYFAVCFALLLYPPAQIPIALCMLFGAVGFLLSRREYLSRGNLRKTGIAFAVAGVLAGVALAAFYLDFKEIISAIQNTVYPGHRTVTTGGGTSLLQLVGGYFNVFLMRGSSPKNLGFNQSEGASFFLFSLFLLPLFVFGLVRSRMVEKSTNWSLVAVLGAYLLMLCWMLFGLPGWLASILLLSSGSPTRAWLAVGMLNLFLVFYYLCRSEFQFTLDFKIFAWIASAAVFLILLSVGLNLQRVDPKFLYNGFEAAGIAALSAGMLLLLLLRRKRSFTVLLFLFSLASAGLVNPLYRGLGPLLHSDLSAAIRKINEQDQRRSVWLLYDQGFGNYLAANGVRVLGGVYVYPNLAFWEPLDPQGQHTSVLNRYGNVTFLPGEPGSAVVFKRPAADNVQITIDPCDPSLQTLDVNYFIFSEPSSAACLRQVDKIKYRNFPLYIYQRTK